jgi:hypothetical protein
MQPYILPPTASSVTAVAKPCGVCLQAPIDFNQYIGIQRMGVTCLGLGQEVQAAYNASWAARGAALAGALRHHCGWEVEAPAACGFGSGGGLGEGGGK